MYCVMITSTALASNGTYVHVYLMGDEERPYTNNKDRPTTYSLHANFVDNKNEFVVINLLLIIEFKIFL